MTVERDGDDPTACRALSQAGNHLTMTDVYPVKLSYGDNGINAVARERPLGHSRDSHTHHRPTMGNTTGK